MLMAIARLNIPSIVVTAGPMLSGNYRGRRLSLVKDTFEAVGRFRKGDISQEELTNLEMCACPGAGACQGLYTANTMACVSEAMGMSLPGCATALAVSAKKDRIACASGEKIVGLVKRNVLPRTIMRREAFENAIKVDMALGGSTNTVLHLIAIAKETGIEIPMNLFDDISRQTPHIANILPGGEHFMEDLEWAGGIPAIFKRMRHSLYDVMTVSDKLISQIANDAQILNEDVIRDMKNAYHEEGGIAIMGGNLAPDGAVVKQTAVSSNVMKFKGTAKVFDSEESAMQAIMAGKIRKGHVVVIRYEGPRGGPGMREMLSPTSAIVGMGLAEDVALITDGRFSGGTQGPCIGHISPEAACGGPIAAVEEDDEISIDIPARKLNVKLTDNELKARLSTWKAPECPIKEGYLARYARMVSSASEGAVLKT
jgi:dihydroxy-acid dehydratase